MIDTFESDNETPYHTVPPTSKEIFKRGTNDCFVTVLDPCKVSDRDAAHILIATTEALSHDTRNLIINKTSIRQRRQ